MITSSPVADARMEIRVNSEYTMRMLAIRAALATPTMMTIGRRPAHQLPAFAMTMGIDHGTMTDPATTNANANATAMQTNGQETARDHPIVPLEAVETEAIEMDETTIATIEQMTESVIHMLKTVKGVHRDMIQLSEHQRQDVILTEIILSLPRQPREGREQHHLTIKI